MSSSRRLPLTEIPRDICEQELEIESMFRILVRFGDSGSLCRPQGWPNDALKQEATAWILIVVLGSICVIGFYLFWLKTSGDCGSCQVLFGSIALWGSERATENFMDLRVFR
jgi:hypothetical protein